MAVHTGALGRAGQWAATHLRRGSSLVEFVIQQKNFNLSIKVIITAKLSRLRVCKRYLNLR